MTHMTRDLRLTTYAPTADTYLNFILIKHEENSEIFINPIPNVIIIELTSLSING